MENTEKVQNYMAARFDEQLTVIISSKATRIAVHTRVFRQPKAMALAEAEARHQQ